ncbi:hypothetical protein [Gimesia maris]|uniref:hypothetical protein n=1 Tax=Gimesia maris TaxID=122 RepID=UPI0030D9E918|tara:strand:+ start:196582 stop:196863 length:282 start_codon:yes stop_codon:yes gene_type:complete
MSEVNEEYLEEEPSFVHSSMVDSVTGEDHRIKLFVGDEWIDVFVEGSGDYITLNIAGGRMCATLHPADDNTEENPYFNFRLGQPESSSNLIAD